MIDLYFYTAIIFIVLWESMNAPDLDYKTLGKKVPDYTSLLETFKAWVPYFEKKDFFTPFRHEILVIVSALSLGIYGYLTKVLTFPALSLIGLIIFVHIVAIVTMIYSVYYRGLVESRKQGVSIEKYFAAVENNPRAVYLSEQKYISDIRKGYLVDFFAIFAIVVLLSLGKF